MARWTLRTLWIVLTVLVATPALARPPGKVCAGRWPTDYAMQEVCQQKQDDAASRVEAWTKQHTAKDAKTPAGTVLAECTTRWTEDGAADYAMIDTCIQKQWAAHERLYRQ